MGVKGRKPQRWEDVSGICSYSWFVSHRIHGLCQWHSFALGRVQTFCSKLCRGMIPGQWPGTEKVNVTSQHDESVVLIYQKVIVERVWFIIFVMPYYVLAKHARR